MTCGKILKIVIYRCGKLIIQGMNYEIFAKCLNSSLILGKKPPKREEFIPFGGYSMGNRLTEQILKLVRVFAGRDSPVIVQAGSVQLPEKHAERNA